jgi:hypothetical protein
MANLLKMAMIDSIVALHRRGWSNRRIARELGIDRDAVSRHVRQAAKAAKAAKAPPGSGDGAESSKAAKAPPGSEGFLGPTVGPGCRSLCAPWEPVILAKLETGLSAQRIYQDLISDHGFTGKYHSVRRYVRQLGLTRDLPFRRMECAPGEEAQVDFGSGIPIMGADHRRRRTHIFPRSPYVCRTKFWSQVFPN